jgi:hypothetical protein
MKTPEDYLPKKRKASARYKARDNLDPVKRQGFVGLFHPYKGPVYSGFKIQDNEDLYDAYFFGENAIISNDSYGNYTFSEDIEKHCLVFDVNRVHGILRPPSENGVVNNPADSNLMDPATPPGMIQGAHRFSELSLILPQIDGVIIDDFWANYGRSISYDNLKDIKDALLGKSVDNGGMVDHNSPSKTPDLKLFVVTYEREINHLDENALSLIDGISLWIYNQEQSYSQLGSYINGFKANHSEKELLIGIYIHNGNYGDMSHESISHMLEESIDFYEKGMVSGVLLFAGHWLVKDYISQERSQHIDLSDTLYGCYYPYLGEAKCQISDEDTGKLLDKVWVRIGKVADSGKTVWAARKLTNEMGTFRFSGWSGRLKRSNFVFTAEKDGYEPIKGVFNLLPNQSIDLPPLCLKPLASGRKIPGRARDEELTKHIPVNLGSVSIWLALRDIEFTTVPATNESALTRS